MILCDTHCDTLWKLAKGQTDLDVSPEKMLKGGVTLQTMAMFTAPKGLESDAVGNARKELAAFHMLRDHGMRTVDDPCEIKDGDCAMMLSVEGAEPFGDSLEIIDEYRREGVRMVALTWNYENAIGYPAKDGTSNGLKPFGLTAVRRMQDLGMAIDVSHLNEAGFYDLFNKTNKVPLASHSCVAKLCPHFRNLTDDQIKQMIRNGGYIGVNFYTAFLSPDGKADADTIVDHIDYICQLGGSDCVGLGSDFDGISQYPDNVRDCTQTHVILDTMRRRGFDEDTIEKVAGKNLLRYYAALK